jgi:hypothetical protein
MAAIQGTEVSIVQWCGDQDVPSTAVFKRAKSGSASLKARISVDKGEVTRGENIREIPGKEFF